MMAAKGKKSSKAEREAGAKNLAKYRETNSTPALKHGGYSRQIKRKYGDGRTQAAKKLNTAIRALVDDLGGQSTLSAPQAMLLDNIRSKLIVLFQISEYVDTQDSIINNDGELIPCLGRNFTTYAESLRRDLEALYAVKRKVGSVPSIQDIINKSDEHN